MSNDFKQESTQKFIDNCNLFLHLVQNHKGTDAELINLLKMNHDMSRSFLIDLGVEFKETDTIYALNMRIREMEANNSKEVGFEDISMFIKNAETKLKADIKDKGINGSLKVAFSPNLCVTLHLFAAKSNDIIHRDSYRFEKDYLIAVESAKKRHEAFLENFEIIWDGENSYELDYTQTNLMLLKNMISRSLGVPVDSFEYTIGYVYHTEGDKEITLPYISNITATVWTLPSSRGLSEAMANR